jgi:hypothetical protein
MTLKRQLAAAVNGSNRIDRPAGTAPCKPRELVSEL